MNTISSIELDWRRENVGISERLLAEKISISSLARPQGTYVFPANGHGRPAKRHAREDFLDRRLWHELCGCRDFELRVPEKRLVLSSYSVRSVSKSNGKCV